MPVPTDTRMNHVGLKSRTLVIASCHHRNDLLEQRVRDRLPAYQVVRLRARHEMSADTLQQLNPEFVFLPHWSWRIPETIHAQFQCVLFHMTDLPYGRGGSPLQNLIVRGQTETMLSALKCVAEVDAGPIYLRRALSLEGTAHEILQRASVLMETMIVEIVETQPAPVPQQGDIVEFTRRRPADGSVAPLNDLRKVYDYIRMLDADGYPPAFLETDHLHLDFSEAHLGEDFVEARVRVRMKPAV